MLAIGTSLRVTPAADMVYETARSGGKVVIVNLQKTPLDDIAFLTIHAKVDDMFEILTKKLNLKIPEFNLNRWVRIKYMQAKEEKQIKVSGIDKNGLPYALFT